MKKNILIILSIILCSSCQDILETKVHGDLEKKNVYQNINSFENLLNACYAKMKNINFLGGNTTIALPDIMSDNTNYSPENNGNFISFHNWKYNSSTPEVEGIWLSAYSIISSANDIINNINTLPYDKNTDKIDSILAQALTIRAFVHLQLYMWFSDTESNRSIIYINSNKDIFKASENMSKNQILTFCSKDLNKAEKYKITNKGNKYLSSACINFIKMQIAIINKDYKEVILQADKVLSVNDNIATAQEFVNMWTRDDSPELLFRIHFTSTDNAQNAWLMYDTRNNRNTWLADKSLINIYQAEDIRLNSYFKKNKDDSYGIKKYLGRENDDMPNGNDVKLMRISEVYLLKAEAMYNLGYKNEDILPFINKIRENRNINTIDETKNILQLIQNEFRREFAFEGKRFHNLKRWNMDIIRQNKSTSQELNNANYHWALPIPYGEINANEDIIQNTNY